MPLESFDKVTELDAIQQRYDMSPKLMQFTIQRLQSDETFLTNARELKDEGWKEWHLLLAIFNGVLNWHLEMQGANKNDEASDLVAQKIIKKFMEIGEQASDPEIPLTYFSRDNLDNWLLMAMMGYLFQHKGAVAKRPSYSRAKIHKIVSRKYKYFELDVQHTAYFE